MLTPRMQLQTRRPAGAADHAGARGRGFAENVARRRAPSAARRAGRPVGELRQPLRMDDFAEPFASLLAGAADAAATRRPRARCGHGIRRRCWPLSAPPPASIYSRPSSPPRRRPRSRHCLTFTELLADYELPEWLWEGWIPTHVDAWAWRPAPTLPARPGPAYYRRYAYGYLCPALAPTCPTWMRRTSRPARPARQSLGPGYGRAPRSAARQGRHPDLTARPRVTG